MNKFKRVENNRKDFLQDFKNYNEGWEMVKENNVLIIYYRDLILNFHEIISKVINHYGFKVPYNIEEFELLKAKGNKGQLTYTGVGEKRIKGK